MRLFLNLFVYQLLSLSLIVCYQNRNILFNEFQGKTQSLNDLSVWRQNVLNCFKNDLQMLSDSVKSQIIACGDQELTKNVTMLTAKDYLTYKYTGTRDYEAKTFAKNARVQILCLASMLTANDTFINQTANGLWSTLEESTWVWPAHMTSQNAGVGLPDCNQWIIDLGNGERSAFCCWLSFLMADKLKIISEMFAKRCDYEVNRRLYEPFMNSTFWWMGWDGKEVNNWNPWINSNLMMCALLNCNNQSQRLALITRCIKSIDNWLNWYSDDGACVEGPAYWIDDAGRLIIVMYYLNGASNKTMDWSSNQFINTMGSYIYCVHIDKGYFVNHGDAEPWLVPDYSVVYTYGEALNNDNMKQFAAYLYQMNGNDWYLLNEAKSGYLHQFHLQLCANTAVKATTPEAPQPLETWFDNFQLLCIRSVEGSPEGLFMSVKAGNNGESHNHNDVGNFCIYVHGCPALIDIGAGTYSSKYFGADRYTIWNIQSQWHNCPTINGYQQKEGITYKASNVSYVTTSNGGEFVADIAGAYPKEAMVESWVRKLTFDRSDNTINLCDTYKLTQFVDFSKLHFITVCQITYDPNEGQVLFKDQDFNLAMNYDTSFYKVQVDFQNTTDSKIKNSWADHQIMRLTLVFNNNDLKGEHCIRFSIN